MWIILEVGTLTFVASVFSVFMVLCFPQRSHAFGILLLTMVVLGTRPQIARGCHTEGVTLLLSPSHILSTLLFLSFIVSGSASSEAKFSGG